MPSTRLDLKGPLKTGLAVIRYQVERYRLLLCGKKSRRKCRLGNLPIHACYFAVRVAGCKCTCLKWLFSGALTLLPLPEASRRFAEMAFERAREAWGLFIAK